MRKYLDAFVIFGVASMMFALAIVKTQDKPDPGLAEIGHPDTGRILQFEDFVLSYDGRTRQPRWVMEFLTRGDLDGTANRDGSRFTEDKSIPVEFRARLEDYRGSGFDRGHMAPAGDFKDDQGEMNQTFTLSNMSPQLPKFNRQTWRGLETKVRKMVHDTGEAWVITGPLFMPADHRFFMEDGRRVAYQTIGETDIAIPTHYFKIVAHRFENGKRWKAFAWIVPHTEDRIDLADCVTTIDAIERSAGVNFFSNLDAETQASLEGSYAEKAE